MTVDEKLFSILNSLDQTHWSKKLREIIQKAINSNQKTILIAIYNNQNQRRYIGVKLD